LPVPAGSMLPVPAGSMLPVPAGSMLPVPAGSMSLLQLYVAGSKQKRCPRSELN